LNQDEPGQQAAAGHNAVTLERLTIDTTVALDLLDPRRKRHAVARKLVEMAEAGEVEIGVAPQASRFDEHPDLGDFIEQLRDAFPRARIVELPQLPYLSDKTYLDDEFYLDTAEESLTKVWDSVCATWRSDRDGKGPPGAPDAWHLETHVREKRDVFLTNDGEKSGGVLSAVERLNDEHGFAIKAMRLEEFIASRQQ
jgi:hypothetical protein